MSFLIVDGRIINKKDFSLSEDFFNIRLNVSQKIWYGYGGIPLFNENLELLKVQAGMLHLPIPKEFENSRELFRLIKRMLNKNKYYRSGHIILQIFAGENKANTMVTCSAFHEFTFPISEEGLLLKFSPLKKYARNTLNQFPYFNERLWQSALAEVEGTSYQQAIILNEQGFVVECAFSTLAIIIGNEVISPSIQSGCHNSAIRSFLFTASKNIGLTVTEKPFISQEMLLKADELFIVSEEWGLQWVLGVENQRYIHYYSRQINEELNAMLKQKAFNNQITG